MTEPENVPTMAEAEAMVDEAVAREYASWRRFEAKRRYIEPVTQRNREAALEHQRAQRAERERAELARGADRAWRRLYGPEIADALDADESYWLLRAERRCWAFSDRRAILAAAEVVDVEGSMRGVEIEGADGVRIGVGRPELLDLDPGIEGAFIGRATDALQAVDAPLSTFEGVVAERRSEAAEEARRRSARVKVERRRQRERQLYGVELGGSE